MPSQNSFHFEIKGDGVEPGSIPLRDLLSVLSLLSAALLDIAKARGVSESQADFSLVSVKKGNSGDYAIEGSDEANATAGVLTSAIANRDQFLRLPLKAREKVRGIWKWTYNNGYDAVAFSPNGSGISPATISADKELPSEKLTYRGRTTLYGYCFRAGGEKVRSAHLRLADNSKFIVRLKNHDLAREVAGRLYETIGLIGEATWDARSDRLETFVAESLSPYRDREPGADRPRTNLEAFRDLAKAAGNRWDNIDPDEFVQELRRD